MKTSLTRLGMVFIVLAVLVAGCSSTQGTVLTATKISSPTLASTDLVATSTQSTSPTADAPAATSAAPSGSLKFLVVPEKSEARYRVREQLASLKLPSDAIGKTNTITGAVVIQPDGTIVSPDSKFTVDLASLQSDRSMRDNFVRRNTLQTDQFPQAVFEITQVSGLASPLPQSGDFNFKLSGNLTIRDVTKPVTWDVTGQIQAGVITAHATTSFKFEDFNLDQPRVPVVLSVEDNITLELDLTLQHS